MLVGILMIVANLSSTCESTSSQCSIREISRCSQYAHDSLEDKAISELYKLTEIKQRHRFIDSISEHKRGIAFIVRKRPTHNKDYYWIQAGDNTALRFQPIYNFHVYLPDLRVKYFDPFANVELTLEQWRKGE